jgi:AraC-like DNA-binding protein
MLIVAFRQGKALPFYHLPLSELTDWVVDADLIFGNSFHDLREKLVNAPSIDLMFRLLEAYFIQKAGDLLNSNTPQKCIEFAVANISKKPDLTSYQKLDQVIGYSQKHFIDLFKKQVGLAPKQYHKIMRFQKAIVEIESQQSIHWSNIALESGFYDQAHFNNDFKTFSGFTPNEYIKKKSDLINYIPVG